MCGWPKSHSPRIESLGAEIWQKARNLFPDSQLILLGSWDPGQRWQLVVTVGL